MIDKPDVLLSKGFIPNNKVCVVTGGSSGIGKALVLELLDRKAKAVIIADINIDTNLNNKKIHSYKVDVSNHQQMHSFINKIYKTYGNIDLYCSNAGIACDDNVSASADHWNRVWKVNVAQHTYAARECVPNMIKKGSCWFLITASAAGLLSQIGSATYSTTKHAAVGYAEWLSITYGNLGVGVSVLCPQGVKTPMTSKMKNGGIAGIDGMLEADEVAKFTLDGIQSGRFLITPHESVRKYQKFKAENPEKWIIEMRKLNEKFGMLYK